MNKDQNFEIVAGDTANLNVTVTDDVGAKDLIGSTVKWVLWDDASQIDLLIKTIDSGIAFTNAPIGKFSVNLLPIDTVTITPGRYSHECEVTDTTGNVSTVFIGSVIILQTRI